MSTCTACEHSNPDDAVFCGKCGSPIEGIDGGALFRPGDLIAGGRYRIEMLLGEGGMGFVYKATDLTLEREVALKFLHPELTAHPTARRRMAQEARVLARVEHTNVIQVRNVFEEGDLLAMELEFLPGGDLLTRVRQGALDEASAVDLTVKILAGLNALHAAGLVHRDIKPENILLAADGTPKITDLGVARDPKAREKTRLGAALGTPEYMSPEQIQGEVVDHRSDLYSVGILLYQLCTGKLPFAAKSDFDWQVAHVREAPDIAGLRAHVSAGLADVVAKALAKERDARWRGAEDMSAALQDPPSRARKPVTPARHSSRTSTPPSEAAAPSQASESSPLGEPQRLPAPTTPVAAARFTEAIDTRAEAVAPKTDAGASRIMLYGALLFILVAVAIRTEFARKYEVSPAERPRPVTRQEATVSPPTKRPEATAAGVATALAEDDSSLRPAASRLQLWRESGLQGKAGFRCKSGNMRWRDCFLRRSKYGLAIDFPDLSCEEVVFNEEGLPTRLKRCGNSGDLKVPKSAQLKRKKGKRYWSGMHWGWTWKHDGDPYCCQGIWLEAPKAMRLD